MDRPGLTLRPTFSPHMQKTRAALVLSSIFFIIFFDGCSRPAPEVAAASVAVSKTPTRRVSLKEVQPIFNTKCTACHNPNGMDDGVPAASLVLLDGRAAENLIKVKSIESPLLRLSPGDPARSYIHHKIHGTFASVGGGGAQMPLGGSLTTDELALIDDWILSGAPLD